MGLDNPLHIAFLLVILLLVFGAKRLPEIGRSLGSGMREFKDSIGGEDKQQHQAPPAQAALTQPVPQQAPPSASAQAADAFGTPPPEHAPVEPTGQS